MDDQTAIDIAEAHLGSEGSSTEGLKPNVENPSTREHMVVFSKAAESGGTSGEQYRVFLMQLGDPIGVLLSDGTTPRQTPTGTLPRISGEEIVETAARYLQAHGVDIDTLDVRSIQPAELVVVWYQVDAEQVVLGGGYEVYMTKDGSVLRSFTMQ